MINVMSKGRFPKSHSYQGQTDLRRGPWTLEEDDLLIQYIASHGEGRWNFVAESAGLKRTGKSCRLRWLNYLKPEIRRGNLTPQEQLVILELHSKLGNRYNYSVNHMLTPYNHKLEYYCRWSKIAQHLPGRTDNEIKNHWRTRVQKLARQLKLDSSSKKFLEAIRQLLMPRLNETMEQTSSLASVNSSSCSTVETSQKTNSPSPVVTNDVPLHSPCPNPSNMGADSLMSPQVLRFAYGNSLEGDCYDGNGYCMQQLDAQNISVSICHVVDFDWFGEDFGESFWRNDELWQFKNIG